MAPAARGEYDVKLSLRKIRLLQDIKRLKKREHWAKTPQEIDDILQLKMGGFVELFTLQGGRKLWTLTEKGHGVFWNLSLKAKPT